MYIVNGNSKNKKPTRPIFSEGHPYIMKLIFFSKSFIQKVGTERKHWILFSTAHTD